LSSRLVIPFAKAGKIEVFPHSRVDGQAGTFLGAGHELLPLEWALGALSTIEDLKNDDLVCEAPTIVTSQSPSALAHA
jgi:hypothetical protein